MMRLCKNAEGSSNAWFKLVSLFSSTLVGWAQRTGTLIKKTIYIILNKSSIDC
jgi:hypothetical protein